MSMYIPIIKYLQLLLLESTIINNNNNDNDDDDDDDDVMVIDLQMRIAPNAIYNYWQPHSIQLRPYHTEKEGVDVFAFLFKAKCPTV